MDIANSVKSELNRLWGDGKGITLVVVSIGWGLLLGTRLVYPVLLPYLRDVFELSLTVAGFLLTVLWLGSAIGQLPGGLLADRYSERGVLAAGLIITSLSLVILMFASTSLVLFLATAVVGLGQSLYPIARITLLSDIYPERIGSAIGVTMAMGDLGQTVLPPLAGVIAVTISWQMGIGFVIPLLIAASVVIMVALPSRNETNRSGKSLSLERLYQLVAEIRRSNLLFVSFIFFLQILIWQSFTGLYPTYLVEEKGLSPAVTGALFALFFACGIVVKPVAGATYDRIGFRGALVLVFVGPVVGFALLPFVAGVWILVGVTALVSTMLGAGTIAQSYVTEAFSKDIRGTGLGVIRTSTASLGALGPVAFGSIADRGFFDEGYLLLAGVTLLVIFLTIRLPRG